MGAYTSKNVPKDCEDDDPSYSVKNRRLFYEEPHTAKTEKPAAKIRKHSQFLGRLVDVDSSEGYEGPSVSSFYSICPCGDLERFLDFSKCRITQKSGSIHQRNYQFDKKFPFTQVGASCVNFFCGMLFCSY